MIRPSFYHKSFDQLTTTELYDIMNLRQEIFIVEQDCPYLDADGKDLHSEHILLYTNREDNKEAVLIAYARTLGKGISYDNYSSIGRVVTKDLVRGTGMGKKLMQYAISVCKRLYPGDTIKISSQCYAIPFYAQLGFTELGEEYLEDDIPHKAMVLDVA